MKHYLSIALTLAFIGLVISFIVMKRGDNAQHETDAATIADFSNRLDTAQIQIAFCKGTMLTLSNRLDESRSASLTFSNQVIEAESTLALDTEQITNLTGQVAELTSENQSLRTSGQRVMDLTNRVADLARQIALAGTNLDQANKNYALLEERLRRDVAERLVVDRKFNNLTALQGQIWYLQQNPAAAISAESIYAGLDVEVTSNGVHVIAPN